MIHMTNTVRSILSIAVLLALTGILTSCAVLTIDVDVYKGALINEEHVQVHQIVGVVEATKPLLVQLRDYLEWPDSDGIPPKGTTGNPGTSSSWFDGEWISPSACKSPTSNDPASWYKAKYIPPPTLFVPEYRSGGRTLWETLPYVRPTCYNFFTKPHAQQVNQLLKLYEDLDEIGEVFNKTEADKNQVVQCKAQQSTRRIATTLGLSTRLKKLTAQCLNQQGLKTSEHIPDHEDIDALVEFAQQVLFLANHDGLLARPSTPGLITGGLTDLNRILFGDALTDYKYSPYRLFQDDVFEAKQIQYVRVLQAVGNSILFAANELREREGYKNRMERRTPAEVDSANANRSLKDPRTIFQGLLQELGQQAQEARRVLDETGAQLKSMPAPNVSSFQSENKGLAELAALLTEAYLKEIEPQWQDKPARSYADLVTGNEGVTSKLKALSKSILGTQPERTAMIAAAIAYAEGAPIVQGFEAHCMSRCSGPLPRPFPELAKEFARYIEQLNSSRTAEEASLIELQTKRASLEEKKSLNQTKETEFNQAKDTISGIQSRVLERAEKIESQLTTGDLYNLVRLTLSEPTDINNKVPHEAARKVLDALPTVQANAPLNKDDYKSPLEVMDRIIAELRHNHLRVVELEGERAENSQRASNALENARRHRAGMIYLRPASAYLRTSFPSTSLQDDPNLAWDNLLLQQGIRSLPFSSQLRDMLDPIQKQDRSLTAELDKQYWQNINRVRVSGAGLTNQVVAKDDVGNWYVKQYYGDTESIAKGAKNLALFSLGTKLPIDVPTAWKNINQEKDTKKTAEPSDDGNASSQTSSSKTQAGSTVASPLTDLFEKHRVAFETKTAETLETLKALHTNNDSSPIKDQIQTAWGSNQTLKSKMEQLNNSLQIAVRDWDSATLIRTSKPDKDSGQLILKDLRALAVMAKKLAKHIETLETSDSQALNTQEKQQAITLANNVIGPKIHSLLTERQRTIAAYEQAITFIGETANPKQPSSK
ncbi:MAG: hypothetical protein ABL887_04700 [Nitrosomonas sp.]